MASSPITSWEIDGQTMTDFIFLGSKITADGDGSHEIKRYLLLGRKVMTNLDSLLKNRDITLPTKIRLVKAMVFPVVMCGWESWTIKKAECWRIDALELWYWRRLLRVPWTVRRSNQSIIKEISREYSLEGLMLKLKLQYLGHLMRRADSFQKTLMMGKIEGRRRRGWQRMRWLDGITDSVDMSWVNSRSWWWIGRPGVLRFMGSQSLTQLSDWTELNWTGIWKHLTEYQVIHIIWSHLSLTKELVRQRKFHQKVIFGYLRVEELWVIFILFCMVSLFRKFCFYLTKRVQIFNNSYKNSVTA